MHVCVLRLLYDVGWRHAVLCAYGKLILVTSFFKGACVCLCMYVCMYARMYVCTYMYVRICMYVYVCMYV